METEAMSRGVGVGGCRKPPGGQVREPTKTKVGEDTPRMEINF